VVIGVVQQLSALVFEATRLMLVQLLMNSQGYSLNPIQSLYYVSPACLLCLTVPFLVLEAPVMRSSDAWQLRPPVMLANAATAFCLNLAVFLLIGKTSALTMNIAGVIKDWMLIWCAESNPPNCVGVGSQQGQRITTRAAALCHSPIRIRERQHACARGCDDSLHLVSF
jgi:hypothetical protein